MSRSFPESPLPGLWCACRTSFLAFALTIGDASAQAPYWWEAREVFAVSPVTGLPLSPNDYAALTHGQLKHLATAACDELNARLPGGAGAEVNALVRGWYLLDGAGEIQLDPISGRRLPKASASYFNAANVGQLKELARPFYERLNAAGLATAMPWSGAPQATDYAIANLGQAKHAFSFRAIPGGAWDSDGDGLPDEWEWAYFGNLEENGAGDFDGDGISNLAEFQNGSHPGDFFNRMTPVVALVGGDAQAVAPTITAPLPLSVRVFHPVSGAPMPNAPIAFLVASGGGELSPAVTVTASDGTASTVFTAPAFDSSSTIIARPVSARSGAQATLNAQSISPPAPLNLRAAPGSASPVSVLLSWDDVSTTETGFIVEKQNSDGTWSVVGEVAAGVTQFEYVPEGGGTSN